MSKRRLSHFAVNTNDWMNYRPYSNFTSYDSEYLRICNEAFKVLSSPQCPFSQYLNREHRVELSVLLVSLLEDYVNEIGIWSAFVAENKALFGYWLPFFDLTDYDPQYLNPEDVEYLIWHYCGKAHNLWVSPGSASFRPVTNELYDLLNNKADEAPLTDFYDEYFYLPDDIYFFELKAKLAWFSLGSYLLGPAFKEDHKKQIAQLTSNIRNEVFDPNLVDKLVYGLSDDFLYSRHSSFLAHRTPKWFSLVARCSDKLKSDILGMSQRVISELVYEGTEGSQYLFRHGYTKRLFRVNSESCSIEGAAPGDAIFTSLIPWRGEHWVSGTLSVLGKPVPFDQKKISQIDFNCWDASQQQRIMDDAKNIESNSLRFFGDRMVVFENEQQLNAAINEMNIFYNNEVKAAHPEKKQPEYRQNNNAFKKLPQKQCLAMFFEPGIGNTISTDLYQLIMLLQKSEIDQEESRRIFSIFFKFCSRALAKFLIDRYGSRNIRLPMSAEHIPIEPHIDFLLRYYNPGDYAPDYPKNILAQ